MEPRKETPISPGSGALLHRIAGFLLLPALAPLAITALYFTPKETFGCANRGLLAITVTFLSLLCAVATAWKYRQAKARRTTDAVWHLASTLLLILPALLLLGPLG